MIFTREAVQASELLQKGGGAGKESTSIEETILLAALRVRGCSFSVQQNIMHLSPGERSIIKVVMLKPPLALDELLPSSSLFIISASGIVSERLRNSFLKRI